jgi:uncharacterized SAM-dependent methyltransferase
MAIARGHLVEWEKKKHDLQILCGRTDAKICSAVYGEEDTKSVTDAMRKWKTGTGIQGHGKFFDKLVTFLGCSPRTTGDFLIECTYEQWFSAMSAATKRLLITLQEQRPSFIRFEVDLTDHPQKPSTGWLKDRVVDQRFAYLSRASVDRWNALIEYGQQNGQYQVYRNCKTVLEQQFLLRDPNWKGLIDEEKLGCVVVLGAGAPAKDLAILDNLVEHDYFATDRQLKYVIFDNSFFMLVDTVTKVEGWITSHALRRDIETLPCCGNFVDLTRWSDEVRPYEESTSTCFFILGATIGNLDESRLLENLEQVSKPGDILVIGNEFVPNDDAMYESNLLNEYKDVEAQNFVLSSVRELLDDNQFPMDPEKRRAELEVKVEKATRLPGHLRSALPNTIAAVFRLKRSIKSVNLVLAVSKKYTMAALVEACAQFGFEKRSVHYNENRSKTYQYLVLERVAKATKAPAESPN